MEQIQCIIVDDEPVAREILETHLAKIDKIRIVASCKNAVEAFSAINQYNVELIFLDINMPEISGLSFAKSINKNSKIIFTTAYREYAVEGFDLQAVDYLLKPISFERLLQALNKYLSENTIVSQYETRQIEEEKSDYFFVRSDRKMIKISFPEILFIESLSDYLKIQLKDKSVVTRETITNIETKLPQDDFIRIHRSFIVAKAAIESFTSEYIEIGKKQLPVSRSFKNEVLEKLAKRNL
jgi:two-component system LytT family response regulator